MTQSKLGITPALKQRLVFNSSRVHLAELNRRFAEAIPPGSVVLDAGAGRCPYRDFLKHTKYESADHQKVAKLYGDITYACDLQSIPVEDDRFDFVLFNQVLEHLPRPDLVLRELRRVLRPGGQILSTAPFFYEEHECPYDFYRYTQFGQRYQFENAGFEILSISWIEGYWGTLSYQFDTASKYLSLSAKDYGGGLIGYLSVALAIFTKILMVLLAAAFCRLDTRHKYTTKGYPKNYAVLATKPHGID